MCFIDTLVITGTGLEILAWITKVKLGPFWPCKNGIYTQIPVSIFHHIMDITPTKLHDANKMGSTSVLLNGY
jgi:hypothetical protein